MTDMIDQSRGPWVQTASGRRHYLLDPRPEEIDFTDIANHLSKINRFNGSTKFLYSVAQHSVIMCDQAPDELKPYVLLHDGHEAYTGDMATPVQMAMRSLNPDAHQAFKDIQNAHDEAIYVAAGLLWPIPENIKRKIKYYDAAMLSAEKEQILFHDVDWGMELEVPLGVEIIPQPSFQAELEFLRRMERHVAVRHRRLETIETEKD